uniref:F-box protein 3 n=1 Tax=Acanthochromis polyacanthus TaxID=80966 RepID=A0A3Q1GHQ2_9TELE
RVLSLYGASEVELNDIEAQIGCRLPDDYRCSYRIHNGQKLVIPGLMGSMSLSNHYRSEVLLDVETAAGGFQQRKGMRRCLPLTFCFHTGLSQYMALEPAEGRRMFESFYPCPDQTAQDPSAIDMFITGSCFLEWFTTYVHNVVTGEYPIIRDQIFRYVHDKGCVATTGDITVSVSTSFLPELSSVHPPHFFFTYRIRIEMSSSASPEAACQLDSRYWKITTSDGNVEEVQGPGVVGTSHRDTRKTHNMAIKTHNMAIKTHNMAVKRCKTTGDCRCVLSVLFRFLAPLVCLASSSSCSSSSSPAPPPAVSAAPLSSSPSSRALQRLQCLMNPPRKWDLKQQKGQA